MNIVFEYIKYRLKAKGRHGIHSPFIYELVDKCIRTAYSTEDENFIKSLVSDLKKDQRSIEVHDFGAGSYTLGNNRKIHQILATSSSKGKFGKQFYQITKYYQPSKILEFGTSLGIGTIHFALGNKEAEITTIEACPNTHAIANENFSKLQSATIHSVNSTFAHYLEQEPSTIFDLIFIDGHHDGDALLQYCKQLKANMHDDTFIIIDDIRWSDSMFRAWNILKDSDTFHVSIDFFRMGILVPRKGQRKEHFTLKHHFDY